MNHKFVFTLGISILLLYSCGLENKHSDGIFYQDFDNLAAWSNNHSQLSNEIANSGEYSTKMDFFNEFSQTFIIDYSYILSHKYHTINIKAMGYVPEDAEGLCLIVAVDAPDKNLVWEKASFHDQIKGSKSWGEIVLKATLPETAASGTILKVYGWNPKKKVGFLDDIAITFE